MIRHLQRVCLTTACIAACIPFGNAAEFMGLGFLDASDPTSTVRELSADGSTVIGRSPEFGPTGYRWTRETGITQLPHVPGFPTIFPNEISADGKTIFGTNRLNVARGEWEYTLFRWTEDGGITNLGHPIQRPNEVTGFRATTPSGQASAGRNSETGQAFRWSESKGFNLLNDLRVIGVSSV